MKIIAGLKMPYEKQDQVAQNLGRRANLGTTEKLFFRAFKGKYSLIRASKENTHLQELQRKIFNYKSFKGKYSLIRAFKENTFL